MAKITSPGKKLKWQELTHSHNLLLLESDRVICLSSYLINSEQIAEVIRNECDALLISYLPLSVGQSTRSACYHGICSLKESNYYNR